MNKTILTFMALLFLPLPAVAIEPIEPLTMSEADGFQQQVSKCWNVPAESKNMQNSVVTLNVEMAKDGSVLLATVLRDANRTNSDPIYRRVVESAIHAVTACSPYKNLPPEKYATWHEIEMTFDPRMAP
jgi:hypothetical protein